jgi:hypothetical protein
VFNEEAGFCPTCDFDADDSITVIPPLADLWDLALGDLQKMAENQGIRGWRRLKQKSLIWQLNQLRIEQVSDETERTSEIDRQNNITMHTEAFIAASHARDLASAQQNFDALRALTDVIHEDLILTMDWLLLPGQIAEALTMQDIPELAFQIDDPEIHQAANAMILMFDYRVEVENLLPTIDHTTKIPSELVNHADPIVHQLVNSRHAILAEREATLAEAESAELETLKIRTEKFEELTSTRNLVQFPQYLLEHEDEQVRAKAGERLAELEYKEELLSIIESATELGNLTDALQYDEEDVQQAANSRRRSLIRKDKRSLLRHIENSLSRTDIPDEAMGHEDSDVAAAAAKRSAYFDKVDSTIHSISSIYLSEQLDEMLEHENPKVRESARLRLRIFDEMPDKLRERGDRSARLVKMVDDLASEWAVEAAETQRAKDYAQGEADSRGFSLGDVVEVSYIGQNFTGTVQGFTSDGEFVEIINNETSMVWPVPFDCVTSG